MVKVAVAGGRGNLGAAIVETLASDPRHDVIVLSRDVGQQTPRTL